MLEKVKKISNPLTIVAIFASLAEVAGTVSLGLIDLEIQKVFIWYVMGFPVLLVLAFFFTLNWNTKVMYAPGDYADEDNFMSIIRKGKLAKEEMLEEFSEATELIDKTKKEILFEILNEIGDMDTKNKKFVEELIDQKLGVISNKIEETKSNVNVFNEGFALVDISKLTMAELEVFNAISNEPHISIKNLSKLLDLPHNNVMSILYQLRNKGVISLRAIRRKINEDKSA